ncbi:hypothetical protein GF324_08515, partial [bacterium]|nr:hypothetical protein [bacterium]
MTEKLNLTSTVAVMLLVLFAAAMPAPAQGPSEAPEDTLADEPLEELMPEGRQIAGVQFFTIDHALFRYGAETLLLEVYALIDRSFLDTEPDPDGGVTAQYQITFRVLDG